MKVDPSQIEHRLSFAFDTPPGTKVSLKDSTQEDPVWTVFLGMEKNRYILLRLPRELSDGSVIGNRFTVKYLKKNMVFGFSATALHTIRTPFPLLFLDYPKSVESLNLRRHDRAICFLPVTLYHESEQFAGHIIDLSRGGCRIAVDLTVASPLAALEKGFSFFSQFKLNGQEDIYARCSVENLTKNPQKLFLGIKFKELSEEICQQVESYVCKVNEFRLGSSGSPGIKDGE